MPADARPDTRRGRADGWKRLFATLLLVTPLTACTQIVDTENGGNETAPAPTVFDDAGKGWWNVYFKIRRDDSQEPDWHVDALLADQVLAPIVSHTESRIILWRFHRRAGDDVFGHRFSFLFYTDRDTAQTVNNGIAKSALVDRLSEYGVIQEVGLAELDGELDRALGATSDAAWPDEIQRSWPWFIMGVSQTWLKLMSEVRATRPLSARASVVTLLDYYREINDEVSTLWRNQGQHVYFHHLNALFGYQPLIIRETNLKRF
ncbi:MAG: hypothetical protein R3174_12020 [Gammaproteobacteria bacterium]|nr:hypothetical protein [Gammaproteobacteria bacterium]